MQLSSGSQIPDGLLAAMTLRNENSRLGVPSKNPALHQGINACNSTIVLGLQSTAALNRVRSRCTGKERDTESGNDYFGARYYASSMGRFMSPDWAAKAEPVPYAKLDNPQSLNLYVYVGNSPLGRVDLDGHVTALDPMCGTGGACPAPNVNFPENPFIKWAPQQQGSGKPTNQPVDPVPTDADGKPSPPPVPVPGCPTCSWVWNPDKRPNSDDPGRWVPDNYPKTPGGIPEGHWDPGSRGGPGHWDVDQGNGTRSRHYPDGSPMPDDVAHPPGWRPVWNSFAGWVGDHKGVIIGGAVVVGVGAAIILTGGAAAPVAAVLAF